MTVTAHSISQCGGGVHGSHALMGSSTGQTLPWVTHMLPGPPSPQLPVQPLSAGILRELVSDVLK